MSFDAPEPAHPSRFRIHLWRIAATLVGLVLSVLGVAWYSAQVNLDSELAALRSRGLPTSGREVNDYYVVPEGIADTTGVWVAAIDAVRVANLQLRAGTLPIAGTGTKPVPDPGEAWTELEPSRALLGDVEGVRQLILQAAAAGGQARFPVDFSAGFETLLPYTQDARDAARLLHLDACVSAHDRNGTRALDDLRGILALSQALRGEPTVISQLVRIAIHAIACDAAVRLAPHCGWDDSELESLQLSILQARFQPDMASAYSGERAMLLSALGNMPLGPLRATNMREAMRLFERSLEGFAGGWPENLERQREVRTELAARARGQFSRVRLAGVLLLFPALESGAVAGARAEARQKCAVAALALERFRQSRQRWAESLDELDSLIPKAHSAAGDRFVDPFDGKSLRFIASDDRVVIYSIGENQADDGGDVDYGMSEPRRPLDVGFSRTR